MYEPAVNPFILRICFAHVSGVIEVKLSFFTINSCGLRSRERIGDDVFVIRCSILVKKDSRWNLHKPSSCVADSKMAPNDAGNIYRWLLMICEII